MCAISIFGFELINNFMVFYDNSRIQSQNTLLYFTTINYIQCSTREHLSARTVNIFCKRLRFKIILTKTIIVFIRCLTLCSVCTIIRCFDSNSYQTFINTKIKTHGNNLKSKKFHNINFSIIIPKRRTFRACVQSSSFWLLPQQCNKLLELFF